MIRRPGLKRTATFAAIVLLAGGALHANAWSVRAERRDELRARMRALEAREVDDHLEACVARLRVAVDAGAVPAMSRDGVSPLLEDLARELALLGAQDRSMRMRSVRRTGTVLETPIELSFRGTFEETHTFLKNLDARDETVLVKRLSLTRTGDGPPGHLRVAVELSAIERDGGGAP